MYLKGNWFGIPLTQTFHGNQVLTKANLSLNKSINALNTAEYNATQNSPVFWYFGCLVFGSHLFYLWDSRSTPTWQKLVIPAYLDKNCYFGLSL